VPAPGRITTHGLKVVPCASPMTGLVRSRQGKQLVRKVQHETTTADVCRKQIKTKHKSLCMFFNRFGKCERANKCPFRHDVSRVSVCPGFLKVGLYFKHFPKSTLTFAQEPKPKYIFERSLHRPLMFDALLLSGTCLLWKLGVTAN